MSDKEFLAQIIRTMGPIAAYRVSSAPMRRGYAYWGVTPYRIVLTGSGEPCARAVRPARPERRSRRLAERDAFELAREFGAVVVNRIGRLTEEDARAVLRQLGHLHELHQQMERDVKGGENAHA